MQTHDEETRKFFKHSSVHCVLSPRYASNKLSIVKQQACFIPQCSYYFSFIQTSKCQHSQTLKISESSKMIYTGGWDPLHPSSKTCYSGHTSPWKLRKDLCFYWWFGPLCGCYDTLEQRLFRDLDTVFENAKCETDLCAKRLELC